MTTENVSWREQVLHVLKIKAMQDELNINYIQPNLLLPKVSDIDMLWYLFQVLCQEDEGKMQYQLALHPNGIGELFFREEGQKHKERLSSWNSLKEGIDRLMEHLELK